MDYDKCLHQFINLFAIRLASQYSCGYADEDDYRQVGYLNLLKLQQTWKQHGNFKAYAIVAIARAMRNEAINSIYAVSVSHQIKYYIYQIKSLLRLGYTEDEIRDQLDINQTIWDRIKRLMAAKALPILNNEPTHTEEPFSILKDILNTSGLTQNEHQLILTQCLRSVDRQHLSTKQKWRQLNKIRHKLEKSGYGK